MRTVTKTRFHNLGLMHVDNALWRFVDLSDGGEACVGPYYKTKIEALSDLHRYATEVFGVSIADELVASVNHAQALAEALRILNGCAERGLDQSATHDGLSNCDAIAKAREALARWEAAK